MPERQGQGGRGGHIAAMRELDSVLTEKGRPG